MPGKNPRYNPRIHNRQSTRLKGYNYAQAGAYFVTIVTYQRQHLFGIIENGEMRLNQAGKIVQWEWQNLAQRFRFIELGAFIVMPNHFHGILIFCDDAVGATRQVQREMPAGNESLQEIIIASPEGSPLSNGSPLPRPCGPKPASLGAIIGQFKPHAQIARPELPVWVCAPGILF